MRIVVIGGSGHIGTFLVPRLVRAGHEVISISRGPRPPTPTLQNGSRCATSPPTGNNRTARPPSGTGGRPRTPRPSSTSSASPWNRPPRSSNACGARSATCCTAAPSGGTAPATQLPISETTGTAPVGEYGIQKDRIARMLKNETADGGLVTTSLHPGHIVGPGWHPIGPLGNLDPAVWATLSAGLPLRIPGVGAELMHHVHADDVAQAFERAIQHRDAAAGQDFNIVAPTALNVRGFAHQAAAWFGQTASLEPVTWEEFRHNTTPGARAGELGAPLPQSFLLHREGYDPPRLRTEPPTAGRRPGVRPLADRPRRAEGGRPAHRLRWRNTSGHQRYSLPTRRDKEQSVLHIPVPARLSPLSSPHLSRTGAPVQAGETQREQPQQGVQARPDPTPRSPRPPRSAPVLRARSSSRQTPGGWGFLSFRVGRAARQHRCRRTATRQSAP